MAQRVRRSDQVKRLKDLETENARLRMTVSCQRLFCAPLDPLLPLKARCTTGPEHRIIRWEHEHVLEACNSVEVNRSGDILSLPGSRCVPGTYLSLKLSCLYLSSGDSR
jgi:hypothetical protein